MSAPDLAAFLLVRLAEDEAVAVAARDGHDPLDWSTEDGLPAVGMADSDGPSGYGVVIIDPARVLAEVEAKRRIVERAGGVEVGYPSHHLAGGVLSLLAAVYSDHPDYREEWRA